MSPILGQAKIGYIRSEGSNVFKKPENEKEDFLNKNMWKIKQQSSKSIKYRNKNKYIFQ